MLLTGNTVERQGPMAHGSVTTLLTESLLVFEQHREKNTAPELVPVLNALVQTTERALRVSVKLEET